MEALFAWLIRRFRPRVGWPLTLLALCAVLCPAFAAGDSSLRLPAGLFFWAGLLGLTLGMRSSRMPSSFPVPQSPIRQNIARRVFGRVLWIALVGVGLGVIFVLAADNALPPFGLILQDAVALAGWATAALRRLTSTGPPLSRSWIFLAASLPRAWHDLVSAPNGGENGARLIVAAGGVTLTWIGAIVLGRGLARQRPLLAWSLPLLLALALTTILGAGSGTSLVLGLGVLLMLTIVTNFHHRELIWERAGADFSDELNKDVAGWGVIAICGVLTVAGLAPVWLENPLANALWNDVKTPSGLEVLERNIQLSHGGGSAALDTGISKLPALQLGFSLEQAPPDQVALRVRAAQPLPNSPWPHYWRARIFNLYTGAGWTTNARVSSQAPANQLTAFPGAILQEVEDTRADRQIIIGLPDIVAVNIPTSAERLPDGTLAALTERQSGARYQILSQPQEFAAQPPPEAQPPDMRAYLGLPGLPPRVHELAHAIAGDRTNPYEQALALESYLRALPYAYQVQPLPRGGDAVDQFLFDMRQGYCTYYASAMAVMARDLGIPARVASGYATGTYDQTSGVYIVHEAEAHAWPELYVNNRWTPFEPTPIRPLPARTSSAAPPAPAPAPAANQEQARINGPLIWLVVLVVVVLLALARLWQGRRAAPPSLVTQVQIELERQGRRAGIPWPAGATIHEYGVLLAPQLESASAALDEIVELVERARYGGHELQPEEQRRLRAAGERVWTQLGQRIRRS